jgi:magnesium transporter
MQKIQIKNLTWIDIADPKQSDIDYLKSLNFYPAVLNELKYPTLRPKVEQYDDYLYMVLHFPIYRPREKTSKSVEVDFLITKYALITIRYGKNQPLQEFWNKCKNNETEPHFQHSSASLLYCMLQELNNFSLRQIDHITQKVEKLEKEIFGKENRKNEEEIVENISIIRRDILDFRRTIKPHDTILNSLKIHGTEFFGKTTKAYFNDIIGDYMRVWELLDNHKETIESLQQANDSMLSNRTNKTVKTLTILTSIIFSLTLFISLFGMNARYTPIIGAKHDFWIIIGIMLAGALVMLLYYKKKRWL